MIPIPEGAESYPEESQTTGYSESQEALDQPGMLDGSGGNPNEERRRDQEKEMETAGNGLCELSGPKMLWTGNAAGC